MGTEGQEREDLVRAREEISGLRRHLAEERFAEELKDVLTLAASAGEISAPVSHSRLLEMIVETAASVIPSRAASLSLIEEEAEELVFEVALGSKAEEVRKFRIPLGHGIAGLVAVSGQPMAMEEASSYSAADMTTLGLFAKQAAVGIEQSRVRGNLAALLGEALGSSGGVPDHRRDGLPEGARSFAERMARESL